MFLQAPKSASRRTVFQAALLSCSLLFAPSAFSQEFPTKQVRIVLPYATGGSVDFLARVVAEKLSASLGKMVMVEARPGANERIASQHVLMSPADGHTILLVAIPHATNPALFAQMPYDTRKDFQPLIHLVNLPPVLMVPSSSEIKTVPDLIKAAKAKPDAISYSTPGIATGNHLMMELLQELTGTSMIHAPDKGVAAVTTSIAGGHVNVGSITMSPSILSHVHNGRMRVLGVGLSQRSSALPDVPTFGEQGYKEAEYTSWFGLMVRAGTPPAIVDRLNKEINTVLAMPDVREKLESASMLAVGGSPEQFTKHVHSEMDRWGRIIRTRNIRIE